MLFSVELGVSNCSWKQKAPSCSNEIKTIDVTFPDFHQGILLQVHFAHMSSEYLPRSQKSYSNFKAVSSSFFSAHLWLFFSHNEVTTCRCQVSTHLSSFSLFFFFKVYSVLFELLLTCCTFWWPKAWSSQCVTRVFTLDLSANSGHMHLC